MGDVSKTLRRLVKFIRLQAPWGRKKQRQTDAVVRALVSNVALLLGFIGYLKTSPPTNVYGYVENFYKALGLLTLHMPREYPNMPIELQIARFALPLSVAWLTIGTYIDYARRPFRLYAAANARAHLIVCGLTPRAQAVAKQAAAAGRTVVVINADEAATAAVTKLEAAGITVVSGDLDDPGTYARANAWRAAEIAILTGDDVTSLRAAIAVREHVEERRPDSALPLSLVTECAQPDMAAILDGAFQTIRGGQIDYRLFSSSRNVARALLPRLLPNLGTLDRPGAVLIFGLTAVTRAVFEHVLRNAPPSLQVAVAVTDAARHRDEFHGRSPGLSLWPNVDFIEADPAAGISAALAGWVAGNAAATVVIDVGGDEPNLRVALALRRFARDRSLPTGAILIHQAGSGVAIEALSLIDSEGADLSRITHFGSLDDECRPDILFHGILDALARVVHADYLKSGAVGEAAEPWEAVKETYRQASRHQADHLDAKLAALGCRRLAADKTDDSLVLGEGELERLAELEHHRWCMDHWLDGWVLGSIKDSGAKTHPSLIPYEALSEEIKELDRRAVCNLGRLASAAGTSVRKVQRLPFAGPSFDDEASRRLGRACASIREAAEIPVVRIALADGAGIAVARWAKNNDIEYELVLDRPVSVLVKLLPWRPLCEALNGAFMVHFVPSAQAHPVHEEMCGVDEGGSPR